MTAPGAPRLVLTLLATIALGIAACPEPAAECATDADCGAGFRCTEAGSCLHLPPVQGGGGGGGGPTDECEASDDCLAEPFAMVPDIYWDGSRAGDQICTVPLLSCPSGECEVPRECGPLPEDATTPGLFRCELDTDCWSGRCLAREGVRFCLRSCADNGDCPFNDKTGAEPTGFSCERLVDRGVALKSCVPLDPAFPARTLCMTDCDCDLPGRCEPEPGLACRLVGKNTTPLRAVPVCEPLPAGPARESGVRCRGEPLTCLGGACAESCGSSGNASVGFCSELRCTGPCGRDDDCPDRLVCTNGKESERIGTWRAIGADDPTDEGRDIRFCRLPRNGCGDEQDCCPAPDGAGGCLDGWGPVKRRCAVTTSGPETGPHLLTMCADLDPALATPGSCCAAHADCDTNLCVPAREATACAGSGVCSVPCEPDPDAGTGADLTPGRDRCASADFGANVYHQGSLCLPFDYELPAADASGAPGTRLVPLRVCR